MFLFYPTNQKEKTMMKKYKYLLLLLFCFKSQALQKPQQQKQQQQQNEDYDPTSVVLQNIGGVIASFVQLAANPESDCAANHIGGIFQALANICNVTRNKKDTAQMLKQLELRLIAFFATPEGKEFLYKLEKKTTEDSKLI
jgi:hypothetical protein